MDLEFAQRGVVDFDFGNKWRFAVGFFHNPKINRTVFGQVPQQVVAFFAQFVNVHGAFGRGSRKRAFFGCGQRVLPFVFEDDIVAAFAVKNLHPCGAELELIVLQRQFGHDRLQVGRVFVVGALLDFNFFFFVVFGADAVNRFAAVVINQLFAAGVEARTGFVFVAGGFQAVFFDFSGSGVFGFEGVKGVKEAVGGYG